jgi:hypothetical protein
MISRIVIAADWLSPRDGLSDDLDGIFPRQRDHYPAQFRSRVVQIVYGEPCTVIVEMEGSYPFITNEWPCWPKP